MSENQRKTDCAARPSVQRPGSACPGFGQCECCSSALGESVTVDGVTKIICDKCLGFIARWLIQMDAPNYLLTGNRLPDMCIMVDKLGIAGFFERRHPAEHHTGCRSRTGATGDGSGCAHKVHRFPWRIADPKGGVPLRLQLPPAGKVVNGIFPNPGAARCHGAAPLLPRGARTTAPAVPTARPLRETGCIAGGDAHYGTQIQTRYAGGHSRRTSPVNGVPRAFWTPRRHVPAAIPVASGAAAA